MYWTNFRSPRENSIYPSLPVTQCSSHSTCTCTLLASLLIIEQWLLMGFLPSEYAHIFISCYLLHQLFDQLSQVFEGKGKRSLNWFLDSPICHSLIAKLSCWLTLIILGDNILLIQDITLKNRQKSNHTNQIKCESGIR